MNINNWGRIKHGSPISIHHFLHSVRPEGRISRDDKIAAPWKMEAPGPRRNEDVVIATNWLTPRTL